MKKLLLLALVCFVGNSLLQIPLQAPLQAQEQPPIEVAAEPVESPTETTAIEQAIATYVAAFNKKDAAAVALCWAENGVHCVQETGNRTEGRDAIQTDFTTVFKDQPDAALAVTLSNVRMISGDVASAEGVARVAVGGEVNDTAFTAIFKQTEGKWLIDSVHEATLPPPPAAGDYLQQLDWMIGKWVDDTEDVRVETTVRWADSGSFLIRAYTVHDDGQLQQQGTQIIGWDPKQETIRSWLFDADGSFGEGTWTKTDAGWAITGTLTRSDGKVATATQTISVEDENTLIVKREKVEIDGEAQPESEPVRMIRILTVE
jgi:uncharacterized protein (TIGR02246 family)